MDGESTTLPSPTEARLDALCASVATLEQHLSASGPQAARLVRVRFDELRDALRRLVATAHEALGAMPSLDAAAADLERLLAMRVEAVAGSLDVRRRRIAVGVAALHGELVATFARAARRFDQTVLRALRRWQQAHEATEAELRVAAACRRLESGYRGRRLEARRAELACQVQGLKTQLAARRSELAAHRERSAMLWRTLDAALREDVEAVGEALEHILAAETSLAAPALARAGKIGRGAGRMNRPSSE